MMSYNASSPYNMASLAPLVIPCFVPYQASIVGSNDYRHWRQYGVAFGIREGTYDVPNRTHASGHVFNVVSGSHMNIHCVLKCPVIWPFSYLGSVH